MSCPECFQGTEHEGTPRGEVTKLHSLDTYVTEPADGRPIRGIIVIIPDAFGWEFVNNRILADHYADKGNYRVYLPDFMEGHPAPAWLIPKFRVMTAPGIISKLFNLPQIVYAIVPFVWYNRPAKAYPRVTSFLTSLRGASESPNANLPVGIAGFCWGGKLLLMLGGDPVNKALFDAGFTGHPSMLSLPGDVEKLDKPVAFAVGERDSQLPAKSVELIRKEVEGKPEAARGEVVVYEGCGHGFCVRADVATEENVARQAAEAEDQCVRWFDGHFGRKK